MLRNELGGQNLANILISHSAKNFYAFSYYFTPLQILLFADNLLYR